MGAINTYGSWTLWAGAAVCGALVGCVSDDPPAEVAGATTEEGEASSGGSTTVEVPTSAGEPTTTGTSGEGTTGDVDATTGGESTGGGSSEGSTGSTGGAPVCGDGVVEGDELCDDGDLDDGDDCTASCTPAACGDGVVQVGVEGCDDGPANADDAACTLACAPAVCGDGLVQAGVEGCDDGADNGPGQACKADCAVNVCGDGDQGPQEGCDDGNVDAGDGCTDACALEACGNAALDPGEACDDGANGDNDDGCTDLCAAPACGDGFVQASLLEQCDLGVDNSDAGACTSGCALAACGDGLVQGGVEGCDDGDADDTDECAGCQPASCGDGFVQAGVEACDDGNAVNGDGCDEACVEELTAKAVVSGAGLAIPDGLYDGTLGTMACVDLPIANNNTVVTVVVTLGVSHTWVGDLIFKLVAPNDQVLTMMSRPGTAENIDNGVGGTNGDSSNLDANSPVTFSDAGVKDAELMGNTLNDGSTVCKADLQCSYKPNPGAGVGVDFSDFAGLTGAGVWRFCAGDRLKSDLGAIEAVTLELTLM
ncbi:MAG: DUF4215 domain-containing protein [Myxococcales bacterium]|nr:DUF4215 domain-containing protein [Myxococcales bacterium]